MSEQITGQKALILDFGGVISRTLFETHALTEAALGLKEGTLTWRGPFSPETDALWQDMQADRISERDYWTERARETGALVGEDWQDMQSFVKRARGDDVAAIIRREAIAAIREAKAAGCLLAILSNELDLFYGEGFRARLPLLRDFDLIVDASHTGILKPDPRAYESCTKGLNVQAKDCVFVDDQLRNIGGAQRAGWQTVHFDVTAPAASYAKAMALLGVR